jgi:hypothetical protein
MAFRLPETRLDQLAGESSLLFGHYCDSRQEALLNKAKGKILPFNSQLNLASEHFHIIPNQRCHFINLQSVVSTCQILYFMQEVKYVGL